MQRTVWRQWQFCTFQSPQGLRNQGHNDLREIHDLFTGRREQLVKERKRTERRENKIKPDEETRNDTRGDKTNEGEESR